MGFFDSIFSRSILQEDEPTVSFGRYSDSFKAPVKYDYWDIAIKEFGRANYRLAFTSFLDYLKDDDQHNVKYTEVGDEVEFQIYQGSKRLEGVWTAEGLFVEAKIAKTNGFHVGFLRRLIEENYLLKYCKYALDEEHNVTIIYCSRASEASPYKLYYGFKELAIHADKLDDILVDEFDELTMINTGHVKELSENEKKIKHTFITDKIESVFELIDSTKLDLGQYPSAESYLLLSATYILDYLISPEGFMLEKFETIHNHFYHSKQTTGVKTNMLIKKELKEIADRSYEQNEQELYVGISSFGVTSPVSSEQLFSFIESELKQLDWYIKHQHYDVAQAILDFIIGYCLFNYGLSRPISQLFHLYLRVRESKFFVDLDFQPLVKENGELDDFLIKEHFKKIESENTRIYKFLRINTAELSTKSLFPFCQSLVHAVLNLNLNRVDHVDVN